jgi:hypothetical protein
MLPPNIVRSFRALSMAAVPIESGRHLVFDSCLSPAR